MSWFNYYGLIILAVMMIPNVIYAIKSKGNFNDGYHNKAVEILEQCDDLFYENEDEIHHILEEYADRIKL